MILSYLPTRSTTAQAASTMVKNRSINLREAIKEMIAVGAVGPGAHLYETLLGAQFDVSRTPICKAPIQWASTGLIVLGPRRSATETAIEIEP